MNYKYARYTANHIQRSFADNRLNNQPFDMHICNASDDKGTIQELEKMVPTLRNLDFPLDVHKECYMDLFPKDQLIYLTPYSQNVLRDYNADDIYVVGGVIDKGFHGPITLAKAKKFGIRTAWFPFHRYLPWGQASKFLPINIATNILLDFKNTQNWRIALKNVPDRKLLQFRHSRDSLSKKIAELTDQRGEISSLGGRSDMKNMKTLKTNPFAVKK